MVGIEYTISEGPVRSGYTFIGWNTASDGSGTSYSACEVITLTAEGSLVIYAQWRVASSG